MRTIKIIVSYIGTNYFGWQRQPVGASVQGVIEDALFKMTGVKTSVTGASRTDSGVHAFAQVAFFKTSAKIPCQGLVAGLNTILPSDIAITDAKEVDEKFHAINDAKSKKYLYRIYASKTRSPFLEDRAWFMLECPDIKLMKKAAKCFVGKHDFTSFCAAGSSAKTFVREVTKIKISQRALASGRQAACLGLRKAGSVQCPGQIIDMVFEGKGFLRHMIRNIVGTLADVGLGKIKSADAQKILTAKDRTAAGRAAPACGLYLVEVKY